MVSHIYLVVLGALATTAVGAGFSASKAQNMADAEEARSAENKIKRTEANQGKKENRNAGTSRKASQLDQNDAKGGKSSSEQKTRKADSVWGKNIRDEAARNNEGLAGRAPEHVKSDKGTHEVSKGGFYIKTAARDVGIYIPIAKALITMLCIVIVILGVLFKADVTKPLEKIVDTLQATLHSHPPKDAPQSVEPPFKEFDRSCPESSPLTEEPEAMPGTSLEFSAEELPPMECNQVFQNYDSAMSELFGVDKPVRNKFGIPEHLYSPAAGNGLKVNAGVAYNIPEHDDVPQPASCLLHEPAIVGFPSNDDDDCQKVSPHIAAAREVALAGGGLSNCTTVMMRHIPFKYTQRKLMREINSLGFLGKYDFFYLPMDPRSHANRGFAFLNLVSTEAADDFYSKFNCQRLRHFSSDKALAVLPADLQGFDENALRYAATSAQRGKRTGHSKPTFFRNLPAHVTNQLGDVKLSDVVDLVTPHLPAGHRSAFSQLTAVATAANKPANLAPAELASMGGFCDALPVGSQPRGYDLPFPLGSQPRGYDLPLPRQVGPTNFDLRLLRAPASQHQQQVQMFPPQTEAALPNFCIYCGNRRTNDHVFCPYCGQKLVVA